MRCILLVQNDKMNIVSFLSTDPEEKYSSGAESQVVSSWL
jgi:hypothetical protein